MDLEELLSTTREAVINRAIQGLRRVFACKPRVRKHSTNSKVIITKHVKARAKTRSKMEYRSLGQRNIEIPIGLNFKAEDGVLVKEEEDNLYPIVKPVQRHIGNSSTKITSEIDPIFRELKIEKLEEPDELDEMANRTPTANDGYRMSSSSTYFQEQLKHSVSATTTARTIISPKTLVNSPILVGPSITSTSSTDIRRLTFGHDLVLPTGRLVKKFEEDIIEMENGNQEIKAEETSETIKLANRRGRCFSFPVFKEDLLPNPGAQELRDRLVGDVTYDEDQSSDNNIVQDGLKKAKAFLIKNVKAIAMQVIRSTTGAKRP